VPVSAVDPDYPAALIDPEEALYAVRVAASAVKTPGDDKGRYADPVISTFGPTE
jgi:hypothetical protein